MELVSRCQDYMAPSAELAKNWVSHVQQKRATHLQPHDTFSSAMAARRRASHGEGKRKMATDRLRPHENLLQEHVQHSSFSQLSAFRMSLCEFTIQSCIKYVVLAT